jgi:hypothetical protein
MATTGTYMINSTGIPLQPEEGRWMPRRLLGIDGNGRPIYPPTREFELRWGLSNPGETWQLQEWFQGIGATGTISADLPRYAWPTYEFRVYSGIFMQEPEFNTFFAENYTDVTVLLTNITTEEV